MRIFSWMLFLCPVVVISQPRTDAAGVVPGKYSWIEPTDPWGDHIRVSTILKGSAHDMSYVEVLAGSLSESRQATPLRVPDDEEYLFLLKSGTVDIAFADSTWSLGAGSIALLVPNEKFTIRNSGRTPGKFYLMKYRSKAPADTARGVAGGGAFVRQWEKLPFRAHARGGVRSYFERATAMSRRFEMHVTTLKPGLKSHDPHTHAAEEIILMLDDTPEGPARTRMLIGDKKFEGGAGDFYYVSSGLLHGIENIGKTTCSYFAFQFE